MESGDIREQGVVKTGAGFFSPDQPSGQLPMRVTDNKVVVFVDVLGFAALTEAFPVDPDLIRTYDRPFSWNIEKILAAHDNRLTHSFACFHRSLRATLDLAKMSYPLTAIAFSDSAFVATARLFEAGSVAVSLLQSLLAERVPARIGIAYGSFEAIRFRSDVTADGGDHVACFLGTGVVRSHAAEACGIKGMRVLLHPSVVPLLQDGAHNPLSPSSGQLRYLQCSQEERGNPAGVAYEIDFWRFKPTAEGEAWHALQDMWDAAPQEAQVHYRVTAEAINRMRVGRGEPALNNLRRRTLPRSSAAL